MGFTALFFHTFALSLGGLIYYCYRQASEIFKHPSTWGPEAFLSTTSKCWFHPKKIWVKMGSSSTTAQVTITSSITHRIHGTGIFTHMHHKNQLNVGKSTSPMDPMGYVTNQKTNRKSWPAQSRLVWSNSPRSFGLKKIVNKLFETTCYLGFQTPGKELILDPKKPTQKTISAGICKILRALVASMGLCHVASVL